MPEHNASPDPEHSVSLCPDRRAFVRLAAELSATCAPAATGHDVGWPGKVRDISRGGVGLLLRHRFRPGTHLEVDLRHISGRPLRIVRVRVVRAAAIVADNHPCWLLGCVFENPLSDQEFEALL
jgi:hypothetical protein